MKHLKAATGGFTFTLFLITAMVLDSAALAGNVAFQLLPGAPGKSGETFSISCAGELSQPRHDGSTWSMTCKNGGTTPPPKPEPTPPPSTQCGQPVGNSQPLRLGQEQGIRLSMTPINRHFCSTQYPRGTDLSWGPYSASSFSALTVIVSTRVNNMDASSVDRACFRAGPTDRMGVGPSGCRLAPNTLYYVSITAKHPMTGRPTAGGASQLVLFNNRQ